MSDDTDNEVVVKRGKGEKPGIKGAGFGGKPNNGEAHRKGAARRKARQIGNRNLRAALNQERTRMGANEYHMRQAAFGNNN